METTTATTLSTQAAPVTPTVQVPAVQAPNAQTPNEFLQFNLPPLLMTNLIRMGYTTPTPIQAQALPHALAGKDVLGSAQTGTGKTAAFGIPLITRLLTNPRGSALIMTPTRELATQVLTVLKQMLGTRATVATALLIGGESMGPQFQQLRNRPRLIVGTPGRINDHLERGTLMLHDTGFLVLDETDRMLDMGFSQQIEKIVKFLPKQRQTLLFSATFPHNIVKLSEKYLTDPVRVSIGETRKHAENLSHEIIHTRNDNKHELLLKELNARTGTILVFVKTKRGADRLATRLVQQKFSAEAIHGDLKQSKRDRVIAAFRDKQHRILVATDVAARGLDISHIEHVINYDLPHAPEDFIHRIGRTARAGAIGAAISFISPDDMDKWRDIHKLMHPGEPLPPRAPKEHHDAKSRGNSGNGGGGSGSRNRRQFRGGRGRRSGTQGTGASA